MTNELYTENLHLRIEKLQEALQLMRDAVTEHNGEIEDCHFCQAFARAVMLWKEADELEQAAKV